MVDADDLIGPIAELIDAWPMGPDARARVDQVRDRVASPLRVAVAGRVSTGKSTMVNALLQKAAAATGAGEVTRMVTYFQHGVGERVNLVLLDGARIEVVPVSFPLDDGLGLPRGLDPGRISHVEVTLQVARLRSLTLVDTPGLASANVSSTPGTSRVVGGRDGVADDGTSRVSTADAVVYVVNQDARADDAQAIDDFVVATGGGPSAHAPVIAILNRADRYDGTGSADCARLVSALGDRLGHRAVDVVPMVANLAETVLAGRLSQSMVDGLASMAANGPPPGDPIWFDVDYLANATPVEPDRAALLVERLGLYGVREAVSIVRSEDADPTVLATRLLDLSGIAALEGHLDRIAARAEVLKARRALLDLETIAWSSARGEDARRQLAGLRDDPRYDAIDELEIVDGLERRELILDDELQVHALAVLAPGTPSERSARGGLCDGAAWRLWADRWRRFENTCDTPRQARAARIVQRRLGRLRPDAVSSRATRRS